MASWHCDFISASGAGNEKNTATGLSRMMSLCKKVKNITCIKGVVELVTDDNDKKNSVYL